LESLIGIDHHGDGNNAENQPQKRHQNKGELSRAGAAILSQKTIGNIPIQLSLVQAVRVMGEERKAVTLTPENSGV